MRFLNELKNINRIFSSHPLTKSRKIKTYIRFIIFQIQARLKPSTTTWINGLQLNATAGTGITGNVYCGLFELPEMGFVLHYLKKDDCFVDVGANVGIFTLLASGVCQAKSFSFEPVPTTHEKLKKHTEINQLTKKVTLIQKGVSDRSGVLRFSNLSQDCLNHIITDDEEIHDSIDIQVTTLDSELNNKPVPALLKMDIEGHELLALRGADKLLSNPILNAIILECTDASDKYGYSRTDLFEFMKNYQFHPYTYDPIKREIKAEEITSTNDNFIFIRNLEEAQKRIQSAPFIKILDQEI